MFVETKREGEATTKSGPSLAGFAAWLETKNPEEKYNWANCCGECAVSQYFTTFDPVGGHFQLWRDYGGKLDRIARDGPYNFGALLSRARAALSGDQRK